MSFHEARERRNQSEPLLSLTFWPSTGRSDIEDFLNLKLKSSDEQNKSCQIKYTS